MQIHVTDISSNKKTGPLMVTTTSADTCPDNCPMKKQGGCYAESGPLAIHWRKVTAGERGDSELDNLVKKIRKLPAGMLWRHNQAGDLPGLNNDIDADALRLIVKANARRKGFTYTHKPLTTENLAAIRSANAGGFTINLSGNNPAHADSLADKAPDLPVVTVLPAKHTDTVSYAPAGRRIVTCPAAIRDTNCAACGLCARQDRGYIIGFPAHGAHKKAAAACGLDK